MTRSKAAILAVVLLVLVFGARAGAVQAGGGETTERVSVDSAEAQSNLNSDFPSVSTDGRFVAFESNATNLVGGDTNGHTDIFVRDRVLGTTERVSISNTEVQANASSYSASISADGRFVAFVSEATNLVTGDTNTQPDIFVRDRALGTTIRASVRTGGTQGNGLSRAPSISADGRYVAFQSLATNLVSGDTNGSEDVFVRDTTAATTSRASVSTGGTQGNSGSMWCSISADGRYVAFQSDATNFATGDTNAQPDVFVRDRVAGTTSRVSVAWDGSQADDGCWSPSVSADGRFVAFDSFATNLVPGDTLGIDDVFVRDRLASTTERVSVDSGGTQGNSTSWWPQISANGRYVAFVSLADNLVWGDTNGVWDVFVRDRESGLTSRVSVTADALEANGASESCAISADGLSVAFYSDATDMVAGDTNGVGDIFEHVISATIPYRTIRGSDRYDTAIRISQAMFPAGLAPGAGMVLAPGDTFQEALCGAPLAAAYGGPVLLTPRDSIPNSVKNEILRLDPDSVTLIDLSLAQQGEIDDLLGTIGAARLIRGWDVYNMSYRVAAALDYVLGGGSPGGLSGSAAIITRGDLFPDAIGVSPLACSQRWPILLTGSGTTLNTYAAQALSELNITKALKVGTYATLPVGVTGLANLSGADRYFTNVNVAEWSRINAGLTFGHLGVATGDKFPDALAAGPYLAQWNGILMLSPLAGPLPSCIGAEIYANRASVGQVTFFAMIEPVISLVKGLLP